jgi:hypothetical protein
MMRDHIVTAEAADARISGHSLVRASALGQEPVSLVAAYQAGLMVFYPLVMQLFWTRSCHGSAVDAAEFCEMQSKEKDNKGDALYYVRIIKLNNGINVIYNTL